MNISLRECFSQFLLHFFPTFTTNNCNIMLLLSNLYRFDYHYYDENSRGLSMLNNNKNNKNKFISVYCWNKIFREKQFSVNILFIQHFPRIFCHYRKLFHIFICRCQFYFMEKRKAKKKIYLL